MKALVFIILVLLAIWLSLPPKKKRHHILERENELNKASAQRKLTQDEYQDYAAGWRDCFNRFFLEHKSRRVEIGDNLAFVLTFVALMLAVGFMLYHELIK